MSLICGRQHTRWITFVRLLSLAIDHPEDPPNSARLLRGNRFWEDVLRFSVLYNF